MITLPAEFREWPLEHQGALLRRLHREYYWRRPVEWVHDFIRFQPGRGLTGYQEEILRELPIVYRESVRGPHGLGKTTVVALAVLWFAETREGLDWKAITTASVWRQLQVYLWPEIHKWARAMDWDALGRPQWREGTELLDLGIKLWTGQASSVASNRPDAIEGAHADYLLYIMDESKSIIPATFDAIEGAFAGAGEGAEVEAYALSVSTPGEPEGRFYQIQQRRPGYTDWWVRHVTLQESIDAGRVTEDWANQRAKQWGKDSAVYQNRVEGNFASSDENAVIPLSFVEAANMRWQEIHDDPGFSLPPFTCVGVDVARNGPAHTVQATRYGGVIEELRDYQHQDTTETAGQVVGILRARSPLGYASVDVNGVGAGVVDQLREQGWDVEPFSAANRSEGMDVSGELGYANRRAEAWWTMRELLNPAFGHDIALPPDDMLTGDLTAPHYRVLSGGRIQVESKDDIEKRLGRSTDHGDAVVQAFVARQPVEEEDVWVYDDEVHISPF